MSLFLLVTAGVCFAIAIACAVIPTTVGIGSAGWDSSGLLAYILSRFLPNIITWSKRVSNR